MNVKSLRLSEIFFIHGLYKTHSCSLSFLMGCGIFKTPGSICSAFKHFFWVKLKLDSMLHTESYYVETVRTFPHGINFNRFYQFCKNQKPCLLSNFGMVWVKRLDVHKNSKPQTQGTPHLEIPFEKFPHPYAVSQDYVWGRHRDGTDPPARAYPCVASKNVQTAYSFPSWRWQWCQGWGAAMELTKPSTLAKVTPRRWSWLSWQPQNQHSHPLTFSTLLNHNFTVLQDHKKKRIWERKEKYEQEHYK